MATASSLNAIGSLLAGYGLAPSPELLTTIDTYQNNTPILTFANAYVNTNITPAITANLREQLNSIRFIATEGYFLLDLYPPNITVVSSETITPWSANLLLSTGSLLSGNSNVYVTTGNVYSESFDSIAANITPAGVSEIIKRQAQLPFANGMTGFANVFLNAYSAAQQNFEIVASLSLLEDKTYNQSGIGYDSSQDLVTGGIGTNGNLLANVIAGWGTMYDINNISSINDPYVFGQNLLNQGLGYVNALSDQLTATGLDITNLTDRSPTITTTTQEETLVTISTFVGEVEIPTLTETTTVTAVTGNSPTVVLNIYNSVTGSNLQTIANATTISTTPVNNANITALSDYLDLSKIVSGDLLTELNGLGIYSFDDFSAYLSNKVGQGRFKNWTTLSDFLTSLETPTLSYIPSGANTDVLLPSTVSSLAGIYGSGSGPFNNPIMIDYFGATSGTPYTAEFQIINTTYSSLSANIQTAVANLDQAIIDYSNQYQVYLDSEVPDSAVPPDPPVGDGVPPDPLLLPPWSWISSNVAAVVSALDGSVSTTAQLSMTAFYTMLDRLSIEVNTIQDAGIVFDAGTFGTLKGFAENIGITASDKVELETYQLFANLTTDDIYGDTIRAVVAETINTKILNQNGITIFNNPDPRMAIYQSQAQNIPLTTYLSRNK